MLHCISTADVPRRPTQVKLLHHGMGGVAVVPIAYGRHSPAESAGADALRRNRQQNYFSVLEIPLPHTSGAEAYPPRLMHLRSPQPTMAVETVTPLRSIDGDAVYLLVQCQPEANGGGGGAEVQTYLYRREVSANDGDDDGDGADGAASARVRYQRLPRAIDVANRLWTATAAVLTTESAIAVQPMQSLPRPLLVAASGSGLASTGSSTNRRENGGACVNALQWVELTGPTRAEVVRTVELPALSTFEVTSILPIPGSAGRRVLLLCHHAVVEVQAELSPGAASVSVSNVAIRRTWKWSPHDRLTACCLKDYTLCAGTEDGVLVLWDVRQPGSGATEGSGKDRDDEVIGGGEARSGHSCTAAKAALTGLWAPQTSSGFVTCGLDGTVLSWQHIEDDSAAAAMAWQQQQQQQQQQSGDGAARGDANAGGKRVLSSTGGALGAAAAALVSERERQRPPAFPYVAAPPETEISLASAAPRMGVLPGTPGCVAMAGEGNLLVVARDLGTLEVYLCY